MNQSNKHLIEEAITRIQGEEKLNEVLEEYPSDLRADILKKLRESKIAQCAETVKTAKAYLKTIKFDIL